MVDVRADGTQNQASMQPDMIHVHGLTKNYGPHRAIHGLSFSVKKGEVVGFLGPNGAGKTTTMKILTGFMAPTEGSVRLRVMMSSRILSKSKNGLATCPKLPQCMAT
jgi:ABC-type multidrug transport system ATPase subunit